MQERAHVAAPPDETDCHGEGGELRLITRHEIHLVHITPLHLAGASLLTTTLQAMAYQGDYVSLDQHRNVLTNFVSTYPTLIQQIMN